VDQLVARWRDGKKPGSVVLLGVVGFAMVVVVEEEAQLLVTVDEGE